MVATSEKWSSLAQKMGKGSDIIYTMMEKQYLERYNAVSISFQTICTLDAVTHSVNSVSDSEFVVINCLPLGYVCILNVVRNPCSHDDSKGICR